MQSQLPSWKANGNSTCHLHGTDLCFSVNAHQPSTQAQPAEYSSSKNVDPTQRAGERACLHPAAPQTSMLLCSFERCLGLAPYRCDSCAEWVCKQHCQAHTRAYTFWVACQGYQVRQRLGTPLQPGPLVKQRLGTPLQPVPTDGSPTVTGMPPGDDTICEFHRCHRPAQRRCNGDNSWNCHHHTLSSRRRARCWDCGLDRHGANPPSLPAQDSRQQKRDQNRRVGGPLRRMKPKTKDLYNYSVRTFIRRVALHMAWLQTNEGLDAGACAFIMMAWQESETRALVGNLISGIGDSKPSLRQGLHGARRLHTAWIKRELGGRCCPMTGWMARAIAGLLLFWRFEREAFVVLFCVHCWQWLPQPARHKNFYQAR